MAKLLMALMLLGALGCGMGSEPTETAVVAPTAEPVVSRAEAVRMADQMMDCFRAVPALKRAFVELAAAGMVLDGLSEETALEVAAGLLSSEAFWVRVLTGEQRSEMAWLDGMVDLCDPMGERVL